MTLQAECGQSDSRVRSPCRPHGSSSTSICTHGTVSGALVVRMLRILPSTTAFGTDSARPPVDRSMTPAWARVGVRVGVGDKYGHVVAAAAVSNAPLAVGSLDKRIRFGAGARLGHRMRHQGRDGRPGALAPSGHPTDHQDHHGEQHARCRDDVRGPVGPIKVFKGICQHDHRHGKSSLRPRHSTVSFAGDWSKRTLPGAGEYLEKSIGAERWPSVTVEGAVTRKS